MLVGYLVKCVGLLLENSTENRGTSIAVSNARYRFIVVIVVIIRVYGGDNNTDVYSRRSIGSQFILDKLPLLLCLGGLEIICLVRSWSRTTENDPHATIFRRFCGTASELWHWHLEATTEINGKCRLVRHVCVIRVNLLPFLISLWFIGKSLTSSRCIVRSPGGKSSCCKCLWHFRVLGKDMECCSDVAQDVSIAFVALHSQPLWHWPSTSQYITATWWIAPGLLIEEHDLALRGFISHSFSVVFILSTHMQSSFPLK